MLGRLSDAAPQVRLVCAREARAVSWFFFAAAKKNPPFLLLLSGKKEEGA